MATKTGSKAVLLFRVLFAICVSCLSLFYCLVCFLQPCDHLLGNGRPLGCLVCDVSCVFVTFPYGVPDQVLVCIDS